MPDRLEIKAVLLLLAKGRKVFRLILKQRGIVQVFILVIFIVVAASDLDSKTQPGYTVQYPRDPGVICCYRCGMVIFQGASPPTFWHNISQAIVQRLQSPASSFFKKKKQSIN